MSVDVAIYLPTLGGGGAEKTAVIVANGMAARGVQVDLVLANAQGPYLKDVSPDVRIVDLKARRVMTSLPALRRYLREVRPVAMLSLLDYANVVAVLTRRLSGTAPRLVVSERSLVSRLGIGRRPLGAKLLQALMRVCYRRVDGVIAISNGVALDLVSTLALPPERITVIYNAVVTAALHGQAQQLVDHPWLDINAPPVVLGAGRLTAAKDFATLIRAFAKVCRRENCRLVILGEGELRAELEALVASLGLQDRVLLPGFVDNPSAWMARAGVFVLSSAWEGFGNVLVEAMACGVPVVSTNCPGGPREILEDGKWGRLVPPGDANALADAIEQTLRAPGKADVSARARDFAAPVIVEQYLQMLLPNWGRESEGYPAGNKKAPEIRNEEDTWGKE